MSPLPPFACADTSDENLPSDSWDLLRAQFDWASEVAAPARGGGFFAYWFPQGPGRATNLPPVFQADAYELSAQEFEDFQCVAREFVHTGTFLGLQPVVDTIVGEIRHGLLNPDDPHRAAVLAELGVVGVAGVTAHLHTLLMRDGLATLCRQFAVVGEEPGTGAWAVFLSPLHVYALGFAGRYLPVLYDVLAREQVSQLFEPIASARAACGRVVSRTQSVTRVLDEPIPLIARIAGSDAATEGAATSGEDAMETALDQRRRIAALLGAIARQDPGRWHVN